MFGLIIVLAQLEAIIGVIESCQSFIQARLLASLLVFLRAACIDRVDVSNQNKFDQICQRKHQISASNQIKSTHKSRRLEQSRHVEDDAPLGCFEMFEQVVDVEP